MVMMADAGTDDDVWLATADVPGDGLDEQALAQLDDAGADDAALLASADVPDASATRGIPGLASAAGDLAAAVPQGSVLTFLLRMDRVRDNPQAPRVSALLMGIRDWRQVLDGTEIDPVRDLNTILMASANPFGTREHPPDFLAVVRTRVPRAFLRASVEQMTGARAPSIAPPPPLDGDDAGVVSGPLRAHFESLDGGALPRASRAVWRRQGGAEVATIDRYWGPHAVMLLGDDLAVIAPPARVPALLAVLGARAHTASSRDRGRSGGRLIALLQAEGVRNLVALPGRGDVLPRRLDLAIHETRDGGAPDGGAELLAVLHYDNDAQAARVVPLFNALQQDLVDRVNEFASTLQGRLAAGSGAVRFGPLRSAIEVLRARADGNTLRVEATLSSDEVGELLNVQRLAAMFM
jgi:hypothetical protein